MLHINTAAIETDALESSIVELANKRIDELTHAIESKYGFKLHVGCEDEFLVFGKRAREFDKVVTKEMIDAHLTELSNQDADLYGVEVDRIYPEEDVLRVGFDKEAWDNGVRKRSPRIGIPGMRKWEITTKHITEEGKAITPLQQAKAISAIRQYLMDRQNEFGLVFSFSPREISDFKTTLNNPRFLAQLQSKFAPLSIAEAGEARIEIIDSIKHQLTDLNKNANKETKKTIAHSLKMVNATNPKNGTDAAIALNKLFDNNALDKTGVPGAGVDINISAYDANGKNVLFDKNAPEYMSELFIKATHGVSKMFGKNTGSSLLIATEGSNNSYGATNGRLGRSDLYATSCILLNQDKSTGAGLKRSPQTKEERTAAGNNKPELLDTETGKNLRLEIRPAGPGNASPVAHSIYMVSVLAGMQHGLANSTLKTYDDFQKSFKETSGDFEIDKNKGEALDHYQNNNFLKERLGAGLYDAFEKYVCANIAQSKAKEKLQAESINEFTLMTMLSKTTGNGASK
jgi:hypothetical protein